MYTRLSISENSCGHNPPPDVTGCRNDTRQAESTAHQQPLLPHSPQQNPHRINNHLSHAGLLIILAKNLRDVNVYVFQPTPVRARSAGQPPNDQWPIQHERGVRILTPRTVVKYLKGNRKRMKVRLRTKGLKGLAGNNSPFRG